LNNLYISNIPIRLSTKFKNKFLKKGLTKFTLTVELKLRGN